VTFLQDIQPRPLVLADAKGLEPVGLFLGNGPSALEVAVLRAAGGITISTIRAVWSARLAGRATPLLVVVLTGERAALCGPSGDAPPAFLELEVGRVERICRTALAEPDRHAALRFLATVIPDADGPLPGVRNEGLFATHELQKGLPGSKHWTAATAAAKPVLGLRGDKLLERLGYTIEATPGPVSILRAGAARRAVAVFLDRNESPDLPSARFAQLSPVSYALAKADAENLEWVLVSAGSVLRVHPVRTGVGTGRRGRAETFAEIHLDLLAEADAAYLWLIFSADALRLGGHIEELLADSARYAADLGNRLRERVYNEVVPDLALGVLRARGLKRPTSADLTETYQMALVYLFRLLFLAYAEDKELLPYKHNQLYRDRSLKRKAQELAKLRQDGTPFGKESNLWEEIDRLFRAVDKGNSGWGVPAYNGGLFSRDAAVSSVGGRLAEIQMPDATLGPVLTSLLVEGTPEGWGPVDFRSLGVREFGTIYEGLLENELAVAEADLTTKTTERIYAPAGPKDDVVVQKGRAYLYNTSGARKSTGSFFTKHFAVEHLLDHALEPALKEHLVRLDGLGDKEAARQFFDFRVADIAMGSGHFLIAAVDRIERALSGYLLKRSLPEVHAELARLRGAAQKALGTQGADLPIEDTQLLRRQIARRCIYGVDRNRIAVDLARLALWIHTFVPGLPLSFLDHSLVEGNSLVGIGTLGEADQWMGEVAGSLLRIKPEELEPAAEPLRALAQLSDASSAEIEEARKKFHAAEKAAAPVAALFDILAAARLDDQCRQALWQDGARWLKNLKPLPGSEIHQHACGVLAAIPPFHFPVAFPEVFLRQRPGFDVILGNPPWEEATIEEDRFWNRHLPLLHSKSQKVQEDEKKRMRRERPDLWKVYEEEKAEAELMRSVLTSGQFRGMGTGDPDVYKAFYWRFWELLADTTGWAGVVLPRSAMSAKGSAEFRETAFTSGQIHDLTWLLNSGGWVFDDVEPRYTLVLSAFAKRPPTADQTLPSRGPYRSLKRFEEGIAKPALHFAVSEVRTWTDTFALPLLPSEESGDVFLQLRKSPRLDIRIEGAWRARPQRELDATNDKPLMKISDEEPDGYWPIFKGESFDIWEPDTGSYYAWGKPEKLQKALQAKRLRSGLLEKSAFFEFPISWRKNPATLPCLQPRIAFRDITRATDTRTVRAALIPGEVFVTNKAPYLLWPAGDEKDHAYLLGVLCSLPLDWYSRRFVEIGLNFFILNPFPVPRPPRESALWQRVVALAGRLGSPDKRFAQWAKAVGVSCGKLHPDEKQDMIAELDAVVAHLYGLTEAHLRILFETFHEGWDFEDRLRATLQHFMSWKGRA
jgi:hypothetical protein